MNACVYPQKSFIASMQGLWYQNQASKNLATKQDARLDQKWFNALAHRAWQALSSTKSMVQLHHSTHAHIEDESIVTASPCRRCGSRLIFLGSQGRTNAWPTSLAMQQQTALLLCWLSSYLASPDHIANSDPWSRKQDLALVQWDRGVNCQQMVSCELHEGWVHGESNEMSWDQLSRELRLIGRHLRNNLHTCSDRICTRFLQLFHQMGPDPVPSERSDWSNIRCPVHRQTKFEEAFSKRSG